MRPGSLLANSPPRAEAGVVDQHLDRAARARGSRPASRSRSARGRPGRRRARPASTPCSLGELRRQAPQPLLAPGDQGHVRAPASASSRAIAAPIPDEAPVTSAVPPTEGPGAPRARLAQARPSRASRTRVTASGKITRIASRTWAACSSLEPLSSIELDRGDGHVDGELDRVVGPGDLLGALHLLGELLHAAAHLLGVPEQATESSGFHAPIIGDDRRAPRAHRGRAGSGAMGRSAEPGARGGVGRARRASPP